MYNKTIKDFNKILEALHSQRQYVDMGHQSYIDRDMCVFLMNFIQNSAEYTGLMRERNRLHAELEVIVRKLENL